MMRTQLKAVATLAAAAALAATGAVAARADGLPVGVVGVSADAGSAVSLVTTALRPATDPGGDGSTYCSFNRELVYPYPAEYKTTTRVECSGRQVVSVWAKATVEYSDANGCCHPAAISTDYTRYTTQVVEHDTEMGPCNCAGNTGIRGAGYWDIHYGTGADVDFSHNPGPICTVHNEDASDHWVHCGWGTDYINY
jgi:hypothetical protein